MERIELRQRMFLMTRTQRALLWGMAALMAGLLAFIVIWGLFSIPAEQRSWQVVAEALEKAPGQKIMHAVLSVLLLVYFVLIWRIVRTERLVLSPEGIEYRSPLPGWLAWLRPSWQMDWYQLQSATLRQHPFVQGPQGLLLELDDGRQKRRLAPSLWVDPRTYKPGMQWFMQMRSLKARQEWLRREAEQSELLRYLQQVARHVTVSGLDQKADWMFALEKNRHSRGVLIGMAALLVYASVDTVIHHEAYVEAPLRIFVEGGILAALAAALWMRRGQVPRLESIGVGVIFGVMLGIALHPGLLRVNALTDGDGLRSYSYRLESDNTLQPPETRLPVLSFPEAGEYWAQFKPGSLHAIELRHGGLGFYQINLAPLRQQWRDFYRSK